MVTIRPFETTDADYEAFAVLQRSVWPELPCTVDEWKYNDRARDSKYLFRRFVAERNGAIVASGSTANPFGR